MIEKPKKCPPPRIGGGVVTWNTQFQDAMEELDDLGFDIPKRKRVAVYSKLHDLARDFAFTAETFGKVQSALQHLPIELMMLQVTLTFSCRLLSVRRTSLSRIKRYHR